MAAEGARGDEEHLCDAAACWYLMKMLDSDAPIAAAEQPRTTPATRWRDRRLMPKAQHQHERQRRKDRQHRPRMVGCATAKPRALSADALVEQVPQAGGGVNGVGNDASQQRGPDDIQL